jgi:BirA family transcriptional regulator, biotin operon repressor / biotin---[acetyl-CoA-carboxylase] ligase
MAVMETRLVQPEPLSAARLRAAAGRAGSLWTDIRVQAETGSTNADVLACARAGAAEGLVIAAEWQTAGRGRLGRAWVSQPSAALTFSVLLRPRSVPLAARGWVPLLAGVAAASAIGLVTGVTTALKWPNDVLVDGRKLAGILAEQAGTGIAVGVGINVLGRGGELPVPSATSLEAHGAGRTDRNELLAEILRQLELWYLLWSGAASGDADASGLRGEYLRLCATTGQRLRVELPGGSRLTGIAAGVDRAGQLLVVTDRGATQSVSAGDVVHVR